MILSISNRTLPKLLTLAPPKGLITSLLSNTSRLYSFAKASVIKLISAAVSNIAHIVEEFVEFGIASTDWIFEFGDVRLM